MIGFLPLVHIQADVVEHTFRYEVSEPVKSVYLAGSFNNWDKQASPMVASPDGKSFSLTLRLRPGRHQYKFVLNGETWITDPTAKNESDGNGNTNSVLLILPSDYVSVASPADGQPAKSALEHSTEVPYLNYDRGRLTLSLRARPGDLSSVVLRRADGPEVAMSVLPIDDFYCRYLVSIPWNRSGDFVYSFRIKDGNREFAFGKNGLGPASRVEPFRITAKSFQPFEVPGWVEQSVLYQIFPDRFENGDPTNDPKDVQPWSNGKPTWYNRFGGDVAGVRKHIDYLSGLGVDTVYFNPIFSAPSNHRYDATDYLKVDPEFGTNDEFGRLTYALRAKGIRTVLDGVFNHTATNFFAFADVREKGAASRYVNWYTFRDFPVRVEENPNYVAWYNFPSMPKLNLGNPETRDYMLQIPKFWDKHAAIAGWRLDVANEVTMDYWRAFRKTVKGIGRDRWIVGEVWGDGSPWLKGDQWDSVMNYRFREAVLGFVTPTGSGKPSDLLGRLMSVYTSYAPQVSRNMMNLVGSHDTARILTMCGEDRDLVKLAAMIQFTWVGAPSIYYGDELGMSGGPDPDNRRPMRWDTATEQNDFLRLYRQLVHIRRQSRVLQSGDPVVLGSDDVAGTGAFGRVLGRDAAIVAFNRSGDAKTVRVDVKGLPRKTRYRNALTGEELRVEADGQLRVPVSGKSATILLAK